MRCPNCKNEFLYGNRCPVCHIDVALYKRTIRISCALYNEGLEKAKVFNLTGAINALEKSLEFNKVNVDSRNLLGLLYFEIGRIGDAVKHWVLSQSYFKNDNIAMYYLDTIQKNSKLTERLNESTIMFNQALAYLDQQSEDLTVIQLKRALEYNPKFIDALNLLSLCYIAQNDIEKAKQAIERALAIDSGNPLALRYYHETFGRAYNDREPRAGRQPAARHDSGRVDAVKSESIPTPHVKPLFTVLSPSDQKSFKNNFHISEIISFIVGGLCAFAIFYILVLPNEIEKRDETITNMSATLQMGEQQLNEAVKRKEDEIAALSDKNQELQETITRLETEIVTLEKIQRVNQLENVYNSGNLEEALVLILGVEPTGMPADILEKFNTIKTESYAKYAKLMHDNGAKSFNAKDYNQARAEFEACLKYAGNTLGIADDALYLLGLMADNEKDYDTAVKYYKMVFDEYTGSSRFNTVKNRLSALQ